MPSVEDARRGFRVVETTAEDPRSRELIVRLDAEMGERYRPRQSGESAVAAARSAALHVPAGDAAAVLLAVDPATGEAVGHVILRRLAVDAHRPAEWELKRLYVDPGWRGRGIGRALADEVVHRARRGGAARVILQTGDPQHESLALYRSMGFTPIPVYEPYRETMPLSRCFELRL